MELPRSRPRRLCLKSVHLAGAALAFALAFAPPNAPAQEKIAVSDWPEPIPKVFQKADNMPMMVVPAGPFLRGDASAGAGQTVQVGTFYIDRYEVTNAHYRAFMAATGASEPPFMRADPHRRDEQPVVGVTWAEASAYARWAGKRLPTEAEWEKAARGTDSRAYPWGDEFGEGLANTSLASERRPLSVDRFKTTDISPYDVVGMAGNVAEWVSDWHAPYGDSANPLRDPTGPDSGDLRVVRGGSWSQGPAEARATHRGAEHPETRRDFIGFRCVWDPRMEAAQLASQRPETKILRAGSDCDRCGALSSAQWQNYNLVCGTCDAVLEYGCTLSISREEVQRMREEIRRKSSSAFSENVIGCSFPPVVMTWELFEEQFGRLAKAHRPLVGSFKGDISRLYPAHDRRDVFFANMTDSGLHLSVVNEAFSAIVYGVYVPVNGSARERLPIARDTFRVYVLGTDPDSRLELAGEIVVDASREPMSVVFGLEGERPSTPPRLTVQDGEPDMETGELVLSNWTNDETLFVLSNLDDMRVAREYSVPAGGWLVDVPPAGRYRVVCRYPGRPDLFDTTGEFALGPGTLRQTVVAKNFGPPDEQGFERFELAHAAETAETHEFVEPVSFREWKQSVLAP